MYGTGVGTRLSSPLPAAELPSYARWIRFPSEAGSAILLAGVEGGGWRVEGGGWRVEGGGWRVEGGGWRRMSKWRSGVRACVWDVVCVCVCVWWWGRS